MEKQLLQRIDENQIRQAVAEKYGIRMDDVCLYHDYEFVNNGNDKVRHDFIYGIIDFSNKNYKEKNYG